MNDLESSIVAEYAVRALSGLILSWSVGLLPAIVYRYLVYRRPVEKKLVFVRLAPVVVIVGLAFKLVNASIGGARPNGNPIPWIIIYFVGKWIMTRQPVRRAVTSRSTAQSAPPVGAMGAARSIDAVATQFASATPVVPPTPLRRPRLHVRLADASARWHFGQLFVFWVIVTTVGLPLAIGLFSAGAGLREEAAQRVRSAWFSVDYHRELAQHPRVFSRDRRGLFAEPADEPCVPYDRRCTMRKRTEYPLELIDRHLEYIAYVSSRADFDAYTFLLTDSTIRSTSQVLADSVALEWRAYEKGRLAGAEASLADARRFAFWSNTGGVALIVAGLIVGLVVLSLFLWSLWSWSRSRAPRLS